MNLFSFVRFPFLFPTFTAEPEVPSLKEFKNRVFSDQIAKVLDTEETFDYASLSQTSEWTNRAKDSKSKFHSITPEMVKDWTTEAVEAYEAVEAEHEAWLQKHQTGAGASGTATPTKTVFPTRSLSNMINFGQQLLAKNAKIECTTEDKKRVSRAHARKGANSS